MGRKKGKRYSAKFKFNVVLEVLKSDKSDAEVARAYEVHPVTVSRWKREFLEGGAEVFGGFGGGQGVRGPDRPARADVGPEGSRDRSAEEFFFRELSLDDKIQLVDENREEHGLNRCLEALDVSKGTWHDHT